LLLAAAAQTADASPGALIVVGPVCGALVRGGLARGRGAMSLGRSERDAMAARGRFAMSRFRGVRFVNRFFLVSASIACAAGSQQQSERRRR